MTKAPKLLIILLAHHRWNLAILAEMHRTQGSKFVTLKNHLAVSRDSLQRTLKSLIEIGWVKRNPGYGHPLRPEYLLTERGEELAVVCQQVLAELSNSKVETLGLQKWSLPILATMHRGAERFSEIKKALPGSTARALTLALKDLCEAKLIDRSIINSYPPTSVYRLCDSARHLAGLVGQIACNGMPS